MTGNTIETQKIITPLSHIGSEACFCHINSSKASLSISLMSSIGRDKMPVCDFYFGADSVTFALHD